NLGNRRQIVGGLKKRARRAALPYAIQIEMRASVNISCRHCCRDIRIPVQVPQFIEKIGAAHTSTLKKAPACSTTRRASRCNSKPDYASDCGEIKESRPEFGGKPPAAPTRLTEPSYTATAVKLES